MKTISCKLVGALLVLATMPSPSAESPVTVKLTGIVQSEKQKSAILELLYPRGDLSCPILHEHESIDNCEVVSIDAPRSTVQLRLGAGETRSLKLKLDPQEEGGLRSLHLESVGSRAMFDLYQQLCGRTVLFPGKMADFALDLKTGLLSDAQAVKVLNKAFAEKGVETRLCGDKFVYVVPANIVDELKDIPNPPGSAPAANGKPAFQDDIIERGMIKFAKVELVQVLDFYRELSGRTILNPNHLPFIKISVKSQTALTRREGVWMLEALLHLAGIVTVPSGEKFVFAVPPASKSTLPKFDLAAAQAKLRSANTNRATLDLVDSTPDQLLACYAPLVGREPLSPQPSIPRARITLRSHPLSPAEAVFALESVAALHNLRFASVGADRVTIQPVSAP